MEQFSYEENGYNRKEVKKFIKSIISETEEIVNKVKEQNIEIEKLKKELTYYHNLEETLKNAEDESEVIIQNAKENASKIVNDALLRAQEIEKNTKLLERNIKIFKQKLRLLIQQQIEIVDEIEVLELEDD